MDSDSEASHPTVKRPISYRYRTTQLKTQKSDRINVETTNTWTGFSHTHKMSKRFLNIEYCGIKTAIDVTDIERLNQVQNAIKAEFCVSLAQVTAPQLQLYKNTSTDHVISTCALLNSLPEEYFSEGGSSVIVRILALPSTHVQLPLFSPCQIPFYNDIHKTYARLMYGSKIQTVALIEGLNNDELNSLLKTVFDIDGTIVGLEGEVKSVDTY